MVRKSLEEKHLIDALWPSPAPKNQEKDLLAQGNQVKLWYGDMFSKYFRALHSLDSFELRPEVDLRIKSSHTLMLLPCVDHLVFGTVGPILPIVASGMGYVNLKHRDSREPSTPAFGEPDRFEINFDAPSEATDTYTRSMMRQCQCMRCGTKRDVQVVVSVDPNRNEGPTEREPTRKNRMTRSSNGKPSRTTQKYSPGYEMPGKQDVPPPQPPRPHVPGAVSQRPSSPEIKKQCTRCTFLNFPALLVCEMCQADLPESVIANSPSPKPVKDSVQCHSSSTPNAPRISHEKRQRNTERPSNRHSISSSLFSIFPFSQQNQQEHHAKLPPTQQVDISTALDSSRQRESREEEVPSPDIKDGSPPRQEIPSTQAEPAMESRASTPSPATTEPDTSLSRVPEMAMMPLTPSPAHSESKRPVPAGLPSNLMDDFIPVLPAIQHHSEDEDARWGEMSREESRKDGGSNEDEENRNSVAFIDFNAVARDEADVWGDRDV